MIRDFENKKKLRTNIIFYYYIVVFIIQVLWVNLSNFPPLSLRLGMIVATFLPLFFNKEFIPFVFIIAFYIRDLSITPFGYLPDSDSWYFYVPILFLLLFFTKTMIVIDKYNKILLYLFAYSLVIDLLMKGVIGDVSLSLFYGLTLYAFIKNKNDIKLLGFAFVFSAIILSIYLYVFKDFLEIAVNHGNNERSFWVDPNFFTTEIALGYIVSLLYLTKLVEVKNSFIIKTILYISLPLIFYAILISASRTGFILIVFITILCVLISKNKHIHKFLFVIFLFLIVYILYENGYFSTIIYRLLGSDDVKTGAGRTVIWKIFYQNFINLSFLHLIFGNGYENVVKIAGNRYLHNDLLGTLNNGGLLGVILYIGFFFRFIWQSIIHNRFKLVLVVTLSYFITSLTLCNSYNVYYWMFILWGLAIMKYTNYSKKEIII